MTEFLWLLRAEWTKFRTVRGWLIGVVVAALAMLALGVVSASGSHRQVASAPGETHAHRDPPTGPGGESVTDTFAFAHRALDGDGSITARLSTLTGETVSSGGATPAALAPWAKAGLIVKESTEQGSAYAAVMLTGAHGVRLQYNYTGDIAAPGGTAPTTAPRWLRLVRSGSNLTGYASADGTAWTPVGTARLTGLPGTVQVGMFAASPPREVIRQQIGQIIGDMELTRATAVFDQVEVQGGWSTGPWQTEAIGDHAGEAREEGGTVTVAGSGDIAPNVAGAGSALERTLVGAVAGVLVLIVLGVLFITAEYRRGMIRTTFAGSPRRGRVLAAKAIVIGAVAFGAGLVAGAISLPLCASILRRNGNYLLPVSGLTEVRMVVGTAALLAVAAVFALAVATMIRRSAGAVAAIVVLIVMPYLLASAAVLPDGAARWALRVTPAAAFAIQQSIPQYPQVSTAYLPSLGYYPLAPWAGFAVLCAYAVGALGLAIFLLRRRDV
jgi:ABC-type transport system involved in multi-copper enzyme maturation permease subunit